MALWQVSLFAVKSPQMLGFGTPFSKQNCAYGAGEVYFRKGSQRYSLAIRFILGVVIHKTAFKVFAVNDG